MRRIKGAALAALCGLLCALTACQIPQEPQTVDEPAVSAWAEGSQTTEEKPEPEPAPLPEPEPLTQGEAEQILEEVMAGSSAVGVSLTVIEDGEVGASAAWGWAVRGERPMTADTKVRAASLSKTAVGLCAMAMAEDGLADLDAPLGTYWGEGVRDPYAQTQPSIRTLMAHASGLKDFGVTWGLSKLRGILSSSSAWRNVEPGTPEAWYYSNFGVCVLGTTLELSSGQLLDSYFQSRFLEPMGIRASLHAGKLEAEEVASLYDTRGNVLRSPGQQTGQTVPDEIGLGASYYPGGLTISAVDLAKLVSILAGDGMYNGEALLSPQSVEEMETVQFSVDPGDGTTPFDQCLILRRQEDLLGREELYYHTGSAYGVYALLSYDPNTGDGVVVLTTGAPRQVDDRGLYQLCARLSEQLYAAMEEHEA